MEPSQRAQCRTRTTASHFAPWPHCGTFVPGFAHCLRLCGLLLFSSLCAKQLCHSGLFFVTNRQDRLFGCKQASSCRKGGLVFGDVQHLSRATCSARAALRLASVSAREEGGSGVSGRGRATGHFLGLDCFGRGRGSRVSHCICFVYFVLPPCAVRCRCC